MIEAQVAMGQVAHADKECVMNGCGRPEDPEDFLADEKGDLFISVAGKASKHVNRNINPLVFVEFGLKN